MVIFVSKSEIICEESGGENLVTLCLGEILYSHYQSPVSSPVPTDGLYREMRQFGQSGPSSKKGSKFSKDFQFDESSISYLLTDSVHHVNRIDDVPQTLGHFPALLKPKIRCFFATILRFLLLILRTKKQQIFGLIYLVYRKSGRGGGLL